MNSHRGFEIAFVGLKAGIHEFSYRITDKFFEAYQQQDFKHCEATVKLSLEKNNSFMLLKFEVLGKLEVICDRCGNALPLDLWDEFNILVKLVEEPEIMNQQEEDPDVYYISKGESHLHIADWIYEFINLSIPIQRMCREEEIGRSAIATRKCWRCLENYRKETPTLKIRFGRALKNLKT